jgi:hypothetical protein
VDTSVAPGDPYPDAYAMWTFWQGLKLIRTTQQAAGDSKPVWATEFGWSTSDVRNPSQPWLSGVSEQTQADYIGDAADLLEDPAKGLGFVEGAFVYDLRNDGTDPSDGNSNYGLLHRDFSPKPAYETLRDKFAGMAG